VTPPHKSPPNGWESPGDGPPSVPVGTSTKAEPRLEIRAENVPAGISADWHAAELASSLRNLAAYCAANRRERASPGRAGGQDPL
jgi:hypothetical protein